MKSKILQATLVAASVFAFAAPAFADRHHEYRHHYDHHVYHRGYAPGYVYAPPPVVYAPPAPPPVASLNFVIPLR
ncbi:MAG TPA: hypothetical protein VGL83_06455 [Stellaceae bacterium]|jgi:hypothetical protein